MRGLKNSNFGKFLKTSANKGLSLLISTTRNQLMSGVKKDLRRLGEKYEVLEIDLVKGLVSCDGGKWRTPEEFTNEEDIGLVVGKILEAGIEMWRDQFNRKKMKIKLQRGNMIESTIQFDDGAIYGFHEVYEQHKKDPIDDKAKLLAKNVSQSDYSKEIVLKK